MSDDTLRQMDVEQHEKAKAAPVDVLAAKWPVRVHAVGHGQWAFVAGPRSGTGYPSKKAAKEAGEAARAAALARVGGAS